MTYNYNNKDFDVIVLKKNQKNTYIRVKEDLKIYVTTSKLTPNFMIDNLIKNNRVSINKMIDKMLIKNENSQKNYYLGKEINVVIINIVKEPYIENDTLYVKNEKDIEKFYKKEREKIYKEKIDYWYDNFSMKIPYPKLTIRKMTTRWGVNNKRDKKVTLNSELIYHDISWLDYVIVHELSHFIHFNHSKDFWNLVEENYPNYKKIRKEMRS